MLRKSQFLVASLAVCLMIGGLTIVSGQGRKGDQSMISFTRNINVATLDPSLPSQPLGSWVRSLIGNAPLEWRVEDCSEHTGNQSYDADPPICGKLHSRLPDGRDLKIWIAIGSHKTGAQNPAVLWLAYFGVPGQELPAARLSYLPTLIKGVTGRQLAG